MSSGEPDERARLRQQTTLDAQAYVGGTRWWFLGLMGLSIFTCLPLLSIVLLDALNEFQRSLLANQVFDFGKHPLLWCFLVGAISGIPITQYCVTVIVTALHWRPGWQRGLMLAAVVGLSYVITVAVSSYLSEHGSATEMIFVFLRPAPIAVSVTLSLSFVFLARTFYRWVIVVRGRSNTSRPLTLAFCLVFVSSCAIAMALLRQSDLIRSGTYGPTTANVAVQFLLFVGLPAVIASMDSLLLLPGILRQNCGGLRAWSVRFVGLLLIVIAAPVLVWAVASNLPLTNAKMNFETFLATLVQFAGSSIAASAIALGSFLSMRLFGYELVTSRSASDLKK